MTSFLAVETEDFVYAARAMADDFAEPVDHVVARLPSALSDSAGMAGGDPAGRAWAASYDAAARRAVATGVDLTNAGYRLATMCGQSARNYARAEAASAISAHDANLVGRLPWDGELLMAPDLPSAAGGSGGGPPGWSLVQSAVGYVWPDGHQDRLHAAATAWHHAAEVIDDRSSGAALAGITMSRDRLPEADDVVTACNGMHAHASELASVYRSLGDACAQLAQHIDFAHSSAINELEWMLGESAALQAGGAIVSVVTAGAAEAPTQAAQAARIAKAAATIRTLFAAFTAAVRTLTAVVARVVDRAVAVAGRLRRVLGATLHSAPVRTAGRMRSVARAQGFGETGALARLGETASGTKASAEIRDFVPPKVFRDRHGKLTNGTYHLQDVRMNPHLNGKTRATVNDDPKSQFLFNIDAGKATLDAAAFADHHGLWRENQALVYVRNGPVGVLGTNGRATSWLKLTRNGHGVHAWPARGPK